VLWGSEYELRLGLGVERTLHTDICNKSLSRSVSYKGDNESVLTRFAFGLST
jgi:hypothetical protein